MYNCFSLAFWQKMRNFALTKPFRFAHIAHYEISPLHFIIISKHLYLRTRHSQVPHHIQLWCRGLCRQERELSPSLTFNYPFFLLSSTLRFSFAVLCTTNFSRFWFFWRAFSYSLLVQKYKSLISKRNENYSYQLGSIIVTFSVTYVWFQVKFS